MEATGAGDGACGCCAAKTPRTPANKEKSSLTWNADWNNLTSYEQPTKTNETHLENAKINTQKKLWIIL